MFTVEIAAKVYYMNSENKANASILVCARNAFIPPAPLSFCDRLLGATEGE